MLEKNLYALSHAQISHKLKNSMEYNPIDESILNGFWSWKKNTHLTTVQLKNKMVNYFSDQQHYLLDRFSEKDEEEEILDRIPSSVLDIHTNLGMFKGKWVMTILRCILRWFPHLFWLRNKFSIGSVDVGLSATLLRLLLLLLWV